ncbi:MAG TPA: serine acetyltransferase [Kouleothrix sp.]|uniref:serine O-acetyltransferase n=1 Tax=Kouleothrix sp. TaxID=2779161 RepID=UPI002B8A51AC|nr:serine acetyltransferase [Kouleothrix sp.]
MFTLFRHDAYRWAVYYLGRPISDPDQLTFGDLSRLLFQHMALRAVAWFRLGSWFKRKRIPLFPGYIQRRIYRRYGLEIVVGADIGGGLYIAHPIGTVIAPKRMGANCSIIAAVTIGMRNQWDFPEIGDNVFIGAGARVLGGISVGDHAVIGANAVVIHNIPAGATAVGIPAKVVRQSSTLAK